MAKKTGMKLIANNKKAFHDYFIEDTYEAGIALAGTEVKSLRSGKCSIKEAFVRVENGEVYVYDQDAYELRGDMTGRIFRLGQKVRVRVADADKMLKTVDFVLVEED